MGDTVMEDMKVCSVLMVKGNECTQGVNYNNVQPNIHIKRGTFSGPLLK